MFNRMPNATSFVRLARRASMYLAAGAVLVFASSSANASGQCLNVHGRFSLQPLSGPACRSSLGVCAQGTYIGGIRGDFVGTTTSFIPTADTPSTAILGYTTDVVIHTPTGDLTLKNAGVTHTAGDGEFTELLSATGGTGDWAGASGILQTAGTFVFPEGGDAVYEGVICIP
jgi:hypothetical protein